MGSILVVYITILYAFETLKFNYLALFMLLFVLIMLVMYDLICIILRYSLQPSLRYVGVVSLYYQDFMCFMFLMVGYMMNHLMNVYEVRPTSHIVVQVLQ